MIESSRDNWFLHVVVSFAFGVTSASLFWYSLGSSTTRGNNNSSHSETDSRGGSFTRENVRDSTSTNDSAATPRKVGRWSVGNLKSSFGELPSIDDITSRIGELPSLRLRQRTRWPWDRRNTSRSRSPSPRAVPKKAASPDTNDKTGLCIGSIFGLDVGGSLAKLVYFEKKMENISMDTMNDGLREKQYRTAASAQSVLLARRGLQTSVSFSVDKLTSGRGGLARSSSSNSSGGTYAPPRLSNSRSRSLRPSDFRQLRHSESSEEDVKNIATLRQESLPDDVDLYSEATHFQTGESLFRRKTPTRRNSATDATTQSLDGTADRNRPDKTTTSSSSQSSSTNTTGTSLRRSRSLLDLSTKIRDHAKALDRFYNFARRLDTYREGVKDHQLSFTSRELGGEFHFIQFETRRMQNAMELIRTHNLHVNIRSMGATGGGAHKYADQFENELGIDMERQDELDSLVAGMQFVLSTVVGECYTFRPETGGPLHQRNTGGSAATATAASGKDGKEGATGTPQQDHGTSPKKTNTTSATSPNRRGATEKKDMKVVGDDDSQNSNSSTVIEDTKRKEQGARDTHGSQTPSAAETAEQSPGAARKDRSTGDEWWWSRKVQRDAISYSSTYPYLLVNVGTGVSILRVDGPRKYERVSGSTIGGGTYLGLIRLLTDFDDFEDVMRLAERGDPSKVDMLVGDIYGDNNEALEKIGLPSNLVASSFGKLVAKEDPAAGLKEEDLARALLLMITNNIGQVSYLNAKLMKTPRIYFVGNFLRHNRISQRRLSYAINYWSKGEMEALFLEHEGYFGALGAFLLSQSIPHGAGGQGGGPSSSSSTSASSTNGSASRNGSESKAEPVFSHHRRRHSICKTSLV